MFLRLLTPEMAVAKVAQRVSCGGHDVPKSTILRQFSKKGWHNLEKMYRDLARAIAFGIPDAL